MKTQSLKRMAHGAGLGYLVIFITGFYANFSVLESIFEAGAVEGTFERVIQNENAFQLGLWAFLLMVLADVILVVPLYYFFKEDYPATALLSASLRLVNGTLFAVALTSLYQVLPLLESRSFAGGSPDWLSFQVYTQFESFQTIWMIGLVFFGLHLCLLGYLLITSWLFPSWIGILMMTAGIGYLIDSSAQALLQNYAAWSPVLEYIVLIPAVLGEFSLTIWLLVKGIRTS
jgi:hypothetical protein